jgi:hypothetical protein
VDFGLRAEADCTEARKSATPRSSDIRESVGYSGCEEAFENAELFLLNDAAHLPRRLDELWIPQMLHAAAVRRSVWLGRRFG